MSHSMNVQCDSNFLVIEDLYVPFKGWIADSNKPILLARLAATGMLSKFPQRAKSAVVSVSEGH